jgi:hypothetical protein
MRFFLSPAFVLMLVGALWLSALFVGIPHHVLAEPPVSLPRPAATQPARIVGFQTIQRTLYSDGTTEEKSLGIVLLRQGDTFTKQP